MKKILFILLCLFCIMSVNADEQPIKIVPVCSGTYKVGSTFDVFFNVSGATENRFVGAIDGTFTYDKNSYFGYETEAPGVRESKIPVIDELYRKLSLEIYKERIPKTNKYY